MHMGFFAEIPKRSIITTTVHTLHHHAGWWLKFTTFFGSYFKEQRMRSGGFWCVVGPVDVAHKSVGQQFHLPFDRFGDRNPHGAQRGPRTETIESHNENEKSCNIRYSLSCCTDTILEDSVLQHFLYLMSRILLQEHRDECVVSFTISISIKRDWIDSEYYTVSINEGMIVSVVWSTVCFHLWLCMYDYGLLICELRDNYKRGVSGMASKLLAERLQIKRQEFVHSGHGRWFMLWVQSHRNTCCFRVHS